MDAGSTRDADGTVAARGDHTERCGDPGRSRAAGSTDTTTDAGGYDGGTTVEVRPESTDGLSGQVGVERPVVVAVGVAALAVVAAATLSFAGVDGGSGGLTLVGFLTMGVLGLAASSDGEDAVAALTAKVERARAGEDVSFETEREDGLGELAAAVEGVVEDLQECERQRELHERVIESAPVGVTVADATAEDCPLVSVNERFEELTGYEAEECLGRNCRFLQREETDEKPVDEMREAIAAGEEVTVELRNYRRDGTEFWNRVRLAPIEASDGAVTHYVGFQEDVTDRVEYETELERQQSLLDSIFEQVPIHLYVKDTEGRYDRVSSAYVQDTYGWDEERFVGKTDPELFDEPFAQEAYEDDLRVVESGESVVNREEYLPHVDEWNLTTKVPWRGSDGEIRGLFGVSQKITERKERERELAQYRAYTEGILDAIDDVFYVLDENGDLERWNEALADVSGYSEAEMESMNAVDFFVEEDRSTIRRAIEDMDEVTGVPLEARLLTKDGESVPYEFVAAPLDSPDGERAVAGIGRDISERKERERQMEAIVENTEDVIYIKDREGRYQFINEAGAVRLGLDRKEIVGLCDDELFDEATAADIRSDDERVVQNGETVSREVVRPLDGEDRVFLDYKHPYRDETGDIVGMMGVSHEITERKAAEEKLREREQRLEEYREYTEGILDAIDDVFYVLDETGDLQRWNETLAAVTGYDESAIGSMHATDFFAEDDRERIADAIQTALETGDTLVEAPFLTSDGESVPFEFIASRLENPDGDPVVVGIGRDISERKAAEEKLREREQRLEEYREYTEDILDAIDDVFYVFDDTGAIQRWNDSLNEVTGYSDEEVAAMHGTNFFPEDEHEQVVEAISKVFRTGEDERVDAPVLTEDGAEIPYEFVATRVEDPDDEPVLVGVGRDISKRKARERELRETNERLNAIIEASPAALMAVDFDDEVTLWNSAAERIFGWSEAEALGGELPIIPEDRSGEHGEVMDRVRDGEVITAHETKRRRKDGSLIDVSLSVAPLRDSDGEIVGTLGALADITERKTAERELRATKERMQKFIETSPVGVVATDPEGTVTLWNDAMESIFGWSEEEVLWKPFPAISDDQRGEDEVRQRVLAGESFSGVEVQRVRKDGEVIDISLSTNAIRDENGEVTELVAYIEDITERKERERELVGRSAAMEQSIDGMAILDEDGVYEFVNQAHADIYGYDDPSTFVGETWEMCYDETERERLGSEVLPVLTSEGEWRGEAAGYTADEARFPQELSLTVLDDGRQVCVVRDITDRKARERELERARYLLQQAGRIAAVGGWELDLTGEEREMTWTDELYRLHGVPPGTEIDVETAVEFYHSDDREQIRRYFQRAIEVGESYDMEVRLQPEDDSVRWVRAIGEPVRKDGEIVRVRGSIQDITEQKERELALQSLHEATRGLLGVESDEEAAELVVDTAQSVLDVAGVAVYLLDDTANKLDAVACSDGFRTLCDADPVSAGASDSLLWNTYVTGTPTVFDDTTTVANSQVFGEAVSGGLLVPVGDHGVFVVATAERAIDQGVRRLAETLVATTEAAFDRLESEAALRDRDAELEARNTRLRRQIQITDLIRRIDQSLIRAESRAEVESTVCDRLVESDDVAFAWIGTVDPSGERVDPSAWAGDGEEYLDEVSLLTDGEGVEPAVRTAVSEEPTVVGNVVDDLKREAWRKTALAEEFHSVVSVPLAFGEYFYGVLTVYASEPDAFGDLEREVFAELGENVAYSINTVETQRALHTDQLVELTLEFDAEDDVLGRLAAQADCRIEFEGLAAHSEDETGLFLTASGASTAAVTDVLDALVTVRDYRLVAEPGDESEDGQSTGTALFEVTVAGDTLPSQFVRHGAGPRSLVASAEGIEAVVDLPTATDVRAFVEMLAETHPSVDLVSRRSVERGGGTRRALVSSLFESLTDRQLEVLRTAYFAGFFEWPRTSTGEDVAEMLDVSQPTVNRHLRVGQQRLLTQLFEEADAEAEAD
ncbi:PAS domain S-box protein [Halosimplex salinum]|uniref:PAS domain S-box protein n=1 Tax=Halosimplex salinum TaxID=1710538 RepID=UPI000F488EB6|nr:PAS domain S-box protein [Halosimplex salinum]